MVINSIILFISIVNFVLTLFVFLNAKKLKQHISFLIFSFISTLWLFSNFLLRIYPNSISGPLSYGLGILVGTFCLLWFYNLIGEKVPKFVYYFIIPFSTLAFFISSFTNYVVSPFNNLENLGFGSEQKGILFNAYSMYVGLLLFVSLYKLAKKSLQEKNILKKKQIIPIFIGCLIFCFTVLIVDFLLPIFFDNFLLIYLDNVTYFLFLALIIYSIVKHNLFEIKVIVTQLLVVLFLSLLFLNFLFSNSLNEYLWSGAILLISIYFSYLITKSMFTELKINKQLLDETQKNLTLQKELSKKILELSEKTMNQIKRHI